MYVKSIDKKHDFYRPGSDMCLCVLVAEGKDSVLLASMHDALLSLGNKKNIPELIHVHDVDKKHDFIIDSTKLCKLCTICFYIN